MSVAADRPSPEALAAAERLVVDVDGFEGPLDVLLALARAQKVDLMKISILALAEQYLAFFNAARRARIELAADYLVMAAWLAYLKSRLLAPKDEDDDAPDGEELAEDLAHRLARLEAMRDAAARLFARDLKGRDVFPRGAPEAMRRVRSITWTARLRDVIAAYADLRGRRHLGPLEIRRRPLFAVEAALARLRGALGEMLDWSELAAYTPPTPPALTASGAAAGASDASGAHEVAGAPDASGATSAPQGSAAAPSDDEWLYARSARASLLVAALELARDGEVEIRQARPFAPVFLRRRAASPSDAAPGAPGAPGAAPSAEGAT